MSKFKDKILINLFICGFIILFTFLGYFIPYELQKAHYKILLEISNIILGITGVWVAIVYPKAFKNILSNKTLNITKETEAEIEIISNITKIFRSSICVIILSLLYIVTTPAIKYSQIIKSLYIKNLLKMWSYEFFSLLILLLFYGFIGVIWIYNKHLNNIKDAKVNKEIEEGYKNFK